MTQLKVGDIKKLIADMPDEYEVFFRRVAPICGNIEEAGRIEIGKYSTFGIVIPCVIIEPMADEEDAD